MKGYTDMPVLFNSSVIWFSSLSSVEVISHMECFTYQWFSSPPVRDQQTWCPSQKLTTDMVEIL